MNHSKLTAALAATAVLAVPATAAAHQKSSTQSVRAHIRSADQALTMVAERVKHNKDAAAAIPMVKNRRQTQAATREAGRVRGRSAKASALRMVAKQRDANVETYAALVDEVAGDAQVDMANAISQNVNGREKALSTLTGLLAKLPVQAQAGIAKAIAAISGDGQDEVVDIVNAMKSDQLSDAAKPALTAALTTATGAMFTGVDRLQSLVAGLPGPAQGPVQNAINRVTGILQGIFGGGTTSPGATGPGGVTSGLPIPSNLPIPANLPIPSGLPIPSFLPFGGGR